MSITGKIKTLFANKEKTEALFPRTKVKAVSDDNGVGLNVILDDIISKIQSASGGSGMSIQDVLVALSEQDEVRINALGVTGDANIDGALTVGEQGQAVRNLLTWGTPNGDFNDCKQPGFYWMQIPYCTNAPMTDGYGFLEVIQTHKEYDSGVMQRFTEYYSHQVFVRSYINGGWNSWTNPAYPVGAVYISMDPTSPAKLFGGTWQQRTDRFLVAAGNAYAAGATGGSSSNTHDHWQTIGWDGNDLYAISSASYTNSRVVQNMIRTNISTPNTATAATRQGATYSTTIDTRPPYLAVYMWIRTA